MEDLFDRPARWRGEAILALGLEGMERVAAASPGAGFPSALRSLEDGLGLRAGERVVEIGSGLGGVAEWLRVRTGAVVDAVEPLPGSRWAAERLFPLLRHHASPDGLAPVDAVVLAGVLSLVDDIDDLLAAAGRLLPPGGRLGITDVCPLDGRPDDAVAGPNVIRDVPALSDHLARHGFVVTHLGHGTFAPAPDWQAVAAAVHERMCRDHAGAGELALLEEDRRHLERLRDDRSLGSVTLVATLVG